MSGIRPLAGHYQCPKLNVSGSDSANFAFVGPWYWCGLSRIRPVVSLILRLCGMPCTRVLHNVFSASPPDHGI